MIHSPLFSSLKVNIQKRIDLRCVIVLLKITVAMQVTKGGCRPMRRSPNVEADAMTVVRSRCVVKRAWNRLAAGGGVGVSVDLDARDGKCGWGQTS
jgi:hypothetical protein